MCQISQCSLVTLLLRKIEYNKFSPIRYSPKINQVKTQHENEMTLNVKYLEN